MPETAALERRPPRIQWYRCKVPREELSKLNKRSDFKGFLWTLGFLALLAATATAAIYSGHHWPWYATVGLVFVHSTFWLFLINGFHELVHESVFRTRWLNGFFVRIYAFLSWNSHHWFWTSHTEHHKYTLHTPDDMEVVLPAKITLCSYFKSAFFQPMGLVRTITTQVHRAFGNPTGKSDAWTQYLFSEKNPQGRRDLIRWARVLLIGHGAITAVSLAMGWWMVPIVICAGPAYGRWLQFLCNEAQHAGLQDQVPDFRLCCRTIYLNPFLRFVYWNMNYHTEHHMFAAVPCYNLGKLHKLIKKELPPCPSGLLQTWREIAAILRQQKVDPNYQYKAPLPERAAPLGQTPAPEPAL